ncbi:MAG TPA: UDP-N-acetylglucosamine 2-epimerase (non-hydrolyzing), partial [bacterium]|nr:UDP-N-acetylglucosamine 2-epimerase (non-hydrolyzing) [bacterium]
AAALSGFYHGIPVGHVEAGLRTGDLLQPYPEEANRKLTDSLAALYFAPTRKSRENLLREGVAAGRISVTGNTVVDALFLAKEKIKRLDLRNKRLRSLPPGRMILITLHRREIWGPPMEKIFRVLAKLSEEMPDIFFLYPVHDNPRVKEPARRIFKGKERVILVPPLDYSDLLKVMERSYFVVTDSGGIQEEAPSFRKPVLVLRNRTERPEVLECGCGRLAGTSPVSVYKEIRRLLLDRRLHRSMSLSRNPFGDGHASERIAGRLRRYFKENPSR